MQCVIISSVYAEFKFLQEFYSIIMEFVSLFIASLFFSAQFVFNKQCSKNTVTSLQGGLIVNILQSGWITAIFFILSGFSVSFNADSLKYSLCYSLLMLLCNCCMVPALNFGKIAVLSLFTLAGGLSVPSAFGIMFLREQTSIFKIIGIAVILISFLISSADDLFMGNTKKSQSEKTKPVFWILCIIVFFGNGFLSVVSKLHAISENAVPVYSFLVSASLIRFILSIILIFAVLLLSKLTGRKSVFRLIPEDFGITGRKSILPLIFGGLGYAACNGFGNVFSMASQKTMSASLQFPLLSASVVLFTAVLAFIIFREKPKKFELTGMIITACGAIMMIF